MKKKLIFTAILLSALTFGLHSTHKSMAMLNPHGPHNLYPRPQYFPVPDNNWGGYVQGQNANQHPNQNFNNPPNNQLYSQNFNHFSQQQQFQNMNQGSGNQGSGYNRQSSSKDDRPSSLKEFNLETPEYEESISKGKSDDKKPNLFNNDRENNNLNLAEFVYDLPSKESVYFKNNDKNNLNVGNVDNVDNVDNEIKPQRDYSDTKFYKLSVEELYGIYNRYFEFLNGLKHDVDDLFSSLCGCLHLDVYTLKDFFPEEDPKKLDKKIKNLFSLKKDIGEFSFTYSKNIKNEKNKLIQSLYSLQEKLETYKQLLMKVGLAFYSFCYGRVEGYTSFFKKVFEKEKGEDFDFKHKFERLRNVAMSLAGAMLGDLLWQCLNKMDLFTDEKQQESPKTSKDFDDFFEELESLFGKYMEGIDFEH